MSNKNTVGLIEYLNSKTPKHVRFKTGHHQHLICTFKHTTKKVEIFTDSFRGKLKNRAHLNSSSERINDYVEYCTKVYSAIVNSNLAYNISIQYYSKEYARVKNFSTDYATYEPYTLFTEYLELKDIPSISNICKNYMQEMSTLIRNSTNNRLSIPRGMKLFLRDMHLRAFTVGSSDLIFIKDILYTLDPEEYTTTDYLPVHEFILSNFSEITKLHNIIKKSSLRGFIVKFNSEYRGSGVQCMLVRSNHEDSIVFSHTYNKYDYTNVTKYNVKSMREIITTSPKNYSRKQDENLMFKHSNLEASLLRSASCNVLISILSEKLSSKNIHIIVDYVANDYKIRDIDLDSETGIYSIYITGKQRSCKCKSVPMNISSILEDNILNICDYMVNDSHSNFCTTGSFYFNNHTYTVFSFKSETHIKACVLKITEDKKPVKITDELIDLCTLYGVI